VQVRKAVFPVAGLGTRFLPATKASPKEMLTVVDKPVIQYVVEEAYASGIRQMIFVTGRTKRAIEDHFDLNIELENELETKSKKELLGVVRRIKPDDMSCIFVRQEKPLGLGHAVGCAREIIGKEPFAVLLPDDLMVNDIPVTRQLIDIFEKNNASVIGVQEVPLEHVERYGIVEIDDNKRITGIIEKPRANEAKSNLAVSGRYIFTAEIFDSLSQVTPGALGEIQLTDAIQILLKSQDAYAKKFEGKRYDCGDKLGYLQASVEIGAQHQVLGSEFKDWLAKFKI
jgi:UTP--glucose-1-phosphate uridylyltransferase